MSDLNNLFRHHSHSKLTPPKQRLFRESPPQDERSLPPHKSILKVSRKTSSQEQRLPQGLGELSREMSQSGLRRQLANYNRGVCLVLFRKLFFLMAGVFGASLAAGIWDQQGLLMHILLIVSRTNCSLAYHWVGSTACKVVKGLLSSLVYYANFRLLFVSLYPSPRPLAFLTGQILGLQAVVGLWMFECFQGLIYGQIFSTREPYQGIVPRGWMVIKKVVQSTFTSLLSARMFVFLGLIVQSCVMGFIIYTQNDHLFYSLFNWLVIRTSLLSKLILLFTVALLKEVNEWTSVDLLSQNRKQLQVSLLRLNDSENNGSDVRGQIWRYVWSKCEDFWDTEFLSEKYRIQYDILEDRLTEQLRKIAKECEKVSRRVEVLQEGKWWSKFHKSWLAYTTVRLMHNNRHLFFIVEHIERFQAVCSVIPVKLDPLLKLTNKVGKSLEQMADDVEMGELRRPLENWRDYLLSDKDE